MSPLGTEALHEGGNLLHLVTVLLIDSDKFGFTANQLMAPQTFRGGSQCVTDGFRSRQARGFKRP